MRLIKLVGLLSIFAAMSACVTNPNISKQEAFPGLYSGSNVLKSILVLPASNESTDAEAPELYNVTISEPLTNAGYYAFPVDVVTEVLRKEGIADVSAISNLPGSAFKLGFGADAVLFVNITRWEKVYVIFSGGVHVDLQFKLVSTETDEVVWKYSVNQFIDTSGDANGGGGLIGALISTALSTALTKNFTVAQLANSAAVSALPAGPYNSKHRLDGENLTVNPSLRDYDAVDNEVSK
jgi:hypothetical protein